MGVPQNKVSEELAARAEDDFVGWDLVIFLIHRSNIGKVTGFI